MPEERFVTLAEVKSLMEAQSEQRELTQEQKTALEHAKKLSKLPVEKARELQKELSNIEFISDVMSCKIVDVLPIHPDDVRVLFAKERLILEKDHINQILDTVKKYR